MNISKKISLLLIVAISTFACKKYDDPAAQFNAEQKAIDDYLKANVSDLVLYDTYGMRIAVHQFGETPPPQTSQTVTFTYTGKLFSNGTTFSSGTITDKLENISPEGLRYCLSAMLEGSKATFYIPSKYGYGESGSTAGIPANATLTYEVSIDKVVKTAAQQSQFTTDTTAIRQYITTNNIKLAVKHKSGVWYKIEEPGSGIAIRPYDYVSIHYKGAILSSGATFQEGDLTKSIVFGFIDGLKVGLPLTREGGTTTFYIPSGLGYGPSGITPSATSPGIQGNANLIFTTKVNTVTPY